MTILNFWIILTQKEYFRCKKEKNENHHRILHIRNSLYSKLQLQQTIFIFWNNFARKGHFPLKRAKLNITTEFYIFKLVWVPNFSSNWKFSFFEPNLPQRVSQVENGKSEHHHWILHIRISLGTKFHFKQTSLKFGTKFA